MNILSRTLWITLAAGILGAFPGMALPTMVRLGYTNCAACHISPQGAGLLNSYGRGIDQAQSLRGGEYAPSENSVFKAINWGGRITQDVRSVIQEQVTDNTGQPAINFFRPRFIYRNATELGGGFRVSATLTGETASAPRPALKYDPATPASQVFVNTALIQYRAAKSLEFAAGRDQLPSGINIPDLAVFVKSRNRLGYYDAPTQVKMSYWGKRYQITPFAYGPGGNERSGEHESGGGGLAEYDVLGKGRTILGATFLRGTARNGDRRMAGMYARLGFGKWGILAEHDVTDRTRTGAAAVSFRQQTTYAQTFYAIREWLVASLIGERLFVTRPFEERLVAGKFDLTARLASQATVGMAFRVQQNVLTGRYSKSATLQLAFKTVN